MQFLLLLTFITSISYYLSLKKYWMFDFSYEKNLFWNKFVMVDFSLLEGVSFFLLKVDSQIEGDHKAIIDIRFSLLYLFNFNFSINDTRHWNYDEKRFYLEDEEFVEYIEGDLQKFIINLDKWLLTKYWVKFTNGYLQKQNNVIDLQSCKDIVYFCSIIDQVCEAEDISKYTLIYQYLN